MVWIRPWVLMVEEKGDLGEGNVSEKLTWVQQMLEGFVKISGESESIKTEHL